MTAVFDLSSPRRVHVVGVGGPGMSAIALVLAEMGHHVSGSDLKETTFLPRVRAAGVAVSIGHDAAVVNGVDAVTASTAIPHRNVELEAARSLGITVLSRADALAAICAQARSIAVAGTHGKTTTTSMLAVALDAAGMHPSFVVGGQVHEAGTGARWTGSGLLVVEADESDGTFLQLPLGGTILTNVDVDHLDHFGSVDAIADGFAAYLAGIDGPLVVSADDAGAAALADGARRRGQHVVTYGTSEHADVRATGIVPSGGIVELTLERGGERLGSVRLPLRGIHNVRNAAGVVAMAAELGADLGAVTRALGSFGGVGRRFEVRATVGGVTLVDDYAHLPAEIAAVLAAARDSGDGWRRIVAVFQPNRFSRMSVMSPAYADAFAAADLVVLTDVYPSGERPIPGVTGKLVVNAVLDAHPWARVVYLPRRDDLVTFLGTELRDGDVCISMGCGDVADLPDEVRPLLEARR